MKAGQVSKKYRIGNYTIDKLINRGELVEGVDVIMVKRLHSRSIDFTDEGVKHLLLLVDRNCRSDYRRVK